MEGMVKMVKNNKRNLKMKITSVFYALIGCIFIISPVEAREMQVSRCTKQPRAKDGKHGVSRVEDKDSVGQGEKSNPDGEDGQDGEDGENGQDGGHGGYGGSSTYGNGGNGGNGGKGQSGNGGHGGKGGYGGIRGGNGGHGGDAE